MNKLLLRGTLALLCALPLAASAHGDVACPNEPKADWRPQMELQRKLVDQGWRVRQVKTFSTCYEVYGFDAKGERVEAFFNPKTFERIEPRGAGAASTAPSTAPAGSGASQPAR